MQGCDGAHIAEGLCHFGDGRHHSKGLCMLHRGRQRRGAPLDEPRHGGAGRPYAKLTADDVRRIRKLREQGMTYRRLSEMYGVSLVNVCHVVRRTTWQNVE